MIEIIKNYDFFSTNSKDFYSRFQHKSILVQGRHWDKPPFVTIVLLTYKRPDLLQQALDSALNQKNFDDYQILIADNEGEPIEQETLTSKVINGYDDDRIIYYRHSQEEVFKDDAAVRLVRSPWFVFLHDDDILAENHLQIMTDIVRKHKEIKFLGCPAKTFTVANGIVKEKNNKSLQSYYDVRKLLKDTTCFRNWAGLLGALVSRKHYIAIGGMPALEMGCGDKVMVCVFLHHFGTYLCHSDKPLYYYRIGKQQVSYSKSDAWERTLINEHNFEKYAINKYHRFTHKIWERNLAYCTLEKCEFYNRSFYHTKININRVISACGMPADIKIGRAHV